MPAPKSRRPRTYLPEGHPHVVPYLIVRRVPQLIGFLKTAFGATEEARTDLRDGTVTHACLRIGDAVVMLCEARADWPPMPTGIQLYVRDCDTSFDRAVAAGAVPLAPPTTSPDGRTRTASVQDLSGNLWFLATHLPVAVAESGGPAPKAFTAARAPSYAAPRTLR